MITLYCGDEKDVVGRLHGVAMVLTDPPFAVSNDKNVANNWNGYTSDKGAWDTTVDPMWVDRACCALKDGGIFGCFGTFGSLVPVYERLITLGMTFQSHFVWHKANPAPSVHRRMFVHANEIILIYSKGAHWTFNYEESKKLCGGKQMHNVMDAGVCRRVQGRTRKPEKLLTMLIMTLTNKGDTVLDPFCGSGSIVIAADNLGRDAIGIDIDKSVLDTIVEN